MRGAFTTEFEVVKICNLVCYTECRWKCTMEFPNVTNQPCAVNDLLATSAVLSSRVQHAASRSTSLVLNL